MAMACRRLLLVCVQTIYYIFGLVWEKDQVTAGAYEVGYAKGNGSCKRKLSDRAVRVHLDRPLLKRVYG